MYGEQALYDVLDHLSLRRMKPLPKRRRTADALAPGIPPPTAPLGYPLGATTDALIAQADELAAQLQQYIPALDGVQDLLAGGLPPGLPLDYGALPAAIDYEIADADAGGRAVAVRDDGRPSDDAGEDGAEYTDHLQPPGNKKKRKVPANASAAGAEHGGRGDEDEPDDAPDEPDRPGAAPGTEDGTAEPPDGTYVLTPMQRRRLSRFARAGLFVKDLIRARKRQVSVVLEEGEPEDPIALEHALSTSFPFLDVVCNGDPVVRRSKRRFMRVCGSPFRKDDSEAPWSYFPEGTFEYECLSPVSVRFAAEREETDRLQKSFQRELLFQAEKAAEAARQAAALALQTRPKRSDRVATTRPRPTTSRAPSAPDAAAVLALPPATTGKKKKKKRSALANASNPHHLRNYVPSRLPQSGALSSTQVAEAEKSLVSPLPVRFLSAKLPPPRDQREASPTTGPPPASAAATPPPAEAVEEWICPFCEYNLFYGDERAFQRAIRSRKKILRRRRRARERAAAAANGKPVTPYVPPAKSREEDQEAVFEPPHEDVPASITAQTKWNAKGDRDTDHRGRSG